MSNQLYAHYTHVCRDVGDHVKEENLKSYISHDDRRELHDGVTRSSLFSDCQKEHGRCVSSVYLSRSGEDVKVGWVFEKLQHYEDTKSPYVAETWVVIQRRCECCNQGYIDTDIGKLDW